MPLFSPLKNKNQQQILQQVIQKEDEIAKEIEKRRGKSATYTQPLLPDAPSVEEQQDIESFLTEFYGRGIFEKCREMPTLLRQYPDTMGTHYALLVPQVVSFDEFWARYYYRCSRTTVLHEWQNRRDAATAVRAQLSAITVVAPGASVQQQQERGGASSWWSPSKAGGGDHHRKENATHNARHDNEDQVYEEAVHRAAARAALLQVESEDDIQETSTSNSYHCEVIREEEEDATAIGIGFAESG